MTTAVRTGRRKGRSQRQEVKAVRCAIYTRKSTEEGLDQKFNTLEAQRASAEALIASRREFGWVALPERYDDGGFTGTNMKRPALKRLLADIAAGRIDCVAVYRYDRLSRNYLDFARLLQLFEEHEVSFLSVTENFDTSTSVGRLMLNMVFGFAQFERETIADRTRDKMRAARRKGMWTGGYLVLGYDLVDKHLVVNPEEAEQVREIFELYLERRSIRKAAQEVNARGWTTKTWTKKDGTLRRGTAFSINLLCRLLTNPVYIGKTTADGELHDGEHEAIIDRNTWERVQARIAKNGRTAGGVSRNKHGALLRGLLRCAACDSPMIHTYTKKKGRLYRYYVCLKRQKQGSKACPTKPVRAADVEAAVVEKIRAIAKDPALIQETVRQVSRRAKERTKRLQAERRKLQRDLKKQRDELNGLLAALADANGGLSSATERLGELEQQKQKVAGRLAAIDSELAAVERSTVDERDVATALSAFGPVWDELFQAEKERIVRLVIERVNCEGPADMIRIAPRDAGIGALSRELSETSGTA